MPCPDGGAASGVAASVSRAAQAPQPVSRARSIPQRGTPGVNDCPTTSVTPQTDHPRPPPGGRLNPRHGSDDLDRLASAASGGDRRALETLVEALRPAVCRWALMWTGDPDEAEDAAQQVLIRVHQSIERFEPRARVTTWVYRITENVLRDGHRRRTREDDARRKLEALARDASASLQTDASEPDIVAGLMRLMEELSPKQRAVFDLVDLQGHSPRDAAALLKMNDSTVRVHLLRARRALREHLITLREQEQA